jgi:hypothetical protein
MKKIFILLIGLTCCLTSQAQQPFKEYGYKVKVATLSQGKYIEFFDQDTVVQIGTVLLNRRSGKIVSFVQYDTTFSEYSLQPELISRWMSPDPLAEEFYSESPYNFSHNNPIRYVDPDGAAPMDMTNCPTCPIYFAQLYAAGKAYFNNWSGAVQRRVSGHQSIPSSAPVPNDVRQMHNTMSAMQDYKTIAQGVVDVGEGAANIVASIPGIETAGDIAGVFYYGAKGEMTSAGISGIAIFLPAISGSEIRAVKGFASETKLTDHFTKHAKEFGNQFKDAGEYLKGAQNFFKNVTDDVIQYTRKNGDVVQYNAKTNEFGSVTKNGTIRTYFKPEEDKKYFTEQLKKELNAN